MSQVSREIINKKATESKNWIRKILVALDGSEYSEKALDYTLDLAEKYQAEILLVSIIPPFIASMAAYPYTGIPLVPPETMDVYLNALKARHEKILSDAIIKIKDLKYKFKVHTKLDEGRPSAKIVEAAKNEKCDIIVIGSRGLGGIKGFILGSVSHRVANESVCPVLIIK